MYRYILLFFCICFANSADNINDHSFLFLSGWPQSGTSLLQQILHMAPDVSTMIDNCALCSRRCVNVNHEGQWFLGRNSTINDMFMPGKTCPTAWEREWLFTNIEDVDYPSVPRTEPYTIADIPSVDQYTRDGVLASWVPLWNMPNYTGDRAVCNVNGKLHHTPSPNDSLFVEKSPASLAKIYFLFSLTAPISYSTKFIVILKHPVTLNIATLRGFDWLTHVDKRLYRESGKLLTIMNTLEEKCKNVDTLIELLQPTVLHPFWKNSGRNFTLVQSIRDNLIKNKLNNNKFELKASVQRFLLDINGLLDDCPENYLGWLDSMQFLLAELLLARKYGVSVGIVRYEDFDDPLNICNKIFRFIYDRNFKYREAVDQVCRKHFERLPNVRRNLRLITGSYEHLDFLPGRVKITAQSRLGEFQALLNELIRVYLPQLRASEPNSEYIQKIYGYQRVLPKLREYLSVFGYRLPLFEVAEGHNPPLAGFIESDSVFDYWDIGKRKFE